MVVTGSFKHRKQRDLAIFIEQKHVNDRLDLLEGISLHIHPSGLVQPEFYDIREVLPCFFQDFVAKQRQGEIPPTLEYSVYIQRVGEIPERHSLSKEELYRLIGGIYMEHSCERCSHYDNRREIRRHRVEVDDIINGFEHEIVRNAGKLKIRIKVVQFDHPDSPMVHVNYLKINGRSLTPIQIDYFKQFVDASSGYYFK